MFQNKNYSFLEKDLIKTEIRSVVGHPFGHLRETFICLALCCNDNSVVYFPLVGYDKW